MAYVIGDDCIKCGACAEGCPVSAISEGDDKYVIDAAVELTVHIYQIFLFGGIRFVIVYNNNTFL